MNTDIASSHIQSPRIPKTGRIGRLAKFIEKEAGLNVLLEVMQDVDQFESTSSTVRKADWIRVAIQRLEQSVGEETSIRIMEVCGRQCCGQTHRKHARQLRVESESMGAFIEKLNEKGIGGGRLKLVDQDIITGGYDRCYCGQVKQTKVPFPTTTYCHCSVGWYKQLFETALERPVEIELVQSIIAGAESCEFIIHI